MVSLQLCLTVSLILFATGIYGVLARRNLLIMLMSVELMLNAANLAFVSFARVFGAAGGQAGQVFALLSMAVAAAEVAVGLSLLIAVFRTRRTVDAGELDTLRG